MTDLPPLFLDTAFLFALINKRDQWHESARRLQQIFSQQQRLLLTTEFVLMEMADGLSALRFREKAIAAIQTLTRSSQVEIVPATSGLFQSGLALYCQRTDKFWGLTDCTSFVVIEQNGVCEALTSDTHFQQTGFRALMLEE